jgi:hypothetical protein
MMENFIANFRVEFGLMTFKKKRKMAVGGESTERFVCKYSWKEMA